VRRPSLAATCALAALALGASAAAASGSVRAERPTPVLAYYYIWFAPSSWNRAKSDYPLLGRYSSDDVQVMRRHIEWAKAAGIAGFIVSWKSTPTLDRRLAKLVRIANDLDFKLEIIYQGLDFERRPLPVSKVVADLELFAKRYAHNRVFGLFGKPVVIWSGTRRNPRDAVARVAKAVRGKVLLLASEGSVGGYERIGDLVDGDAYYWSSVNPDTYPRYPEKLAALGEDVHSRNGLWIAPAAPGFDAQLVGGTTSVARDGGRTLRREFEAASASSPDAVGLISWNEFSENSHVEPSRHFGTRSLDVLADILGADFRITGDFDSSEAPSSDVGYTAPLLVGLGCLLAVGFGAALWRRQVRRVLDRLS
jgi:hypothetical protein